jgi:hypothetical protein
MPILDAMTAELFLDDGEPLQVKLGDHTCVFEPTGFP